MSYSSINELAKQIREIWFSNPKRWMFCHEMDEIVKNHFIKLVDKPELIAHWRTEYPIEYLIVTDQFTRNAYRENGNERTKNDHLSLSLALELIETGEDFNFTLIERLFILFPLRHQRRTKYLNIIMKVLEKYDFDKKNVLYHKFILATLRTYEEITDNIYLNEKNEKKEKFNEEMSYKHLLDINCQDFSFTKSISISPDNELILIQFIENIKNSFGKLRNIGISLSGGVDSMVLLKIIKDYLPSYNLYAIHICYHNREESHEEMHFLQEYCSYHNIPLYIREINYIKRGKSNKIETNNLVDRDLYEEHTKNIRFATYREIVSRHNLDCICLGHHSDDIIENVLTNLFKGNNLCDLHGMSISAIIDQVHIYRPMLNITKDIIYKIAHMKNIPYFHNTTPPTSNRGFMREQLLPMIYQQFGNGVSNGIRSIGRMSETLLHNYESKISEVKSQTIKTKLGFSTNLSLLNSLSEDSSLFHKCILELFHSCGFSMISQLSFSDFFNYIMNKKDKKIEKIDKLTKKELSNGLTMIKDEVENKLYFFITKELNKFKYENENYQKIINVGEISESKEIINYKGWKIEIVQKTPESKIIPLTYDSVLNGNFHIEIYNGSYLLSNIGFHKYDKLKKNYKKVQFVKDFIPKFHLIDSEISEKNEIKYFNINY